MSKPEKEVTFTNTPAKKEPESMPRKDIAAGTSPEQCATKSDGKNCDAKSAAK